MASFGDYYPSLPVRQMAGEPRRVLDKHGWTQAVAQEGYMAEAIVRALNREPAFDEMLAALNEAELFVGGVMPPTQTSRALLAKIQGAIESAVIAQGVKP